MSAHVELTNIRWFAGGFTMMSRAVQIGENEFTVPLPCQFVSGSVALVPQMEVDEDSQALTWRMNRWTVQHTERKQVLPLSVAGMASAVRAARDFEADPGVGWHSDPVEIESWASAWAERENARMRGDA